MLFVAVFLTVLFVVVLFAVNELFVVLFVLFVAVLFVVLLSLVVLLSVALDAVFPVEFTDKNKSSSVANTLVEHTATKTKLNITITNLLNIFEFSIFSFSPY